MTRLAPGEVVALGRTFERTVDPIGLYRALSGLARGTLLLEAAEPDATTSGRSLIITRSALRIATRNQVARIDPKSAGGENLLPSIARELEAHAQVQKEGRALVATFPSRPAGDERARLRAPSVLDAVRAALGSLKLVGGDTADPPLCAGCFGYDLLAAYEKLPDARHDPLGWPDSELWLAEELLWVDPHTRSIRALRYAFGGEAPTYYDAAKALGELIARCGEGSLPVPEAAPAAEPEVDLDDASYEALVRQLKEHIVAGDVFQIVASRRFSLPCPDPLAAYARLRAVEPSPYMFFSRGERGTLFGASPESALSVDAQRRVTISPIAGTRRRGRLADGGLDQDLDGRIEAELRLDEKELAEHMMLVDLARNDVARVSVPGSRTVTSLLDVVRYSRVMHLVSEVQGVLREDLDALHAYVATMNMGTLVGAPKLEAATLLRQYEAEKRGPYGGAVGYLTADGTLDTCIVIRSATVRDGLGVVRAGAGIVHDSDPAAEADETRRKAAAVLSVLDGATLEGNATS